MSDKVYFRIVLAVSIFVFVAVLVLNQRVLPRPDVIPSFVYGLPRLNATINGTCALLLLASLYTIRVKKNIELHKRINIITFFLSAMFLVSYITYHYLGNETKFPADNALRPVYLII